MALLVNCGRTRGNPTVFIRQRGGRLDRWDDSRQLQPGFTTLTALLDCSSTLTPERTWLCSHALRPLVLRPLSAQSKLKASTFRNSARMVWLRDTKPALHNTAHLILFLLIPLSQQRTHAQHTTAHTTKGFQNERKRRILACSEVWPPPIFRVHGNWAIAIFSLPSIVLILRAKTLNLLSAACACAIAWLSFVQQQQ